MAAVESTIGERFGPFAGWAHNILFIAELASHRARLPEHLRPALVPKASPKSAKKSPKTAPTSPKIGLKSPKISKPTTNSGGGSAKKSPKTPNSELVVGPRSSNGIKQEGSRSSIGIKQEGSRSSIGIKQEQSISSSGFKQEGSPALQKKKRAARRSLAVTLNVQPCLEEMEDVKPDIHGLPKRVSQADDSSFVIPKKPRRWPKVV
jgi:hypothetical protein